MSRADDTAAAYALLRDLLVGYLTLHRRPDAWDLLDEQNHVAAVICVREASAFVSISLPLGPVRENPKRDAWIVKPYEEELIAYITCDGLRPKRSRKEDGVLLTLERARQFLALLVRAETMSLQQGINLARNVTHG